MLSPRFAVSIASAALLVLGANVVSSQNYPNKPVRIVAPEPGGGVDRVTRILALGLTSALGQQFVVDNRGGSAIIAAQIVAQAPPDGYTLHTSASALWIVPLFQKAPYDPIRDFAPISLTTTSPSVIAVHPSVAAASVKELIALAKARPGQLNFAVGAKGSSTHLGGELFKAMAGINIVAVPYKGAGPALTAVLGGEVQIIVVTASTVMPHVKAGRLRALAVASAQPSMLAPGVPSALAAGLPGYEAGTVHGVFAPAKTPNSIIKQLNQEIVGLLNKPDMKENLFNAGLEVVGSSPDELMATIKSEIARITKLIKDAGIQPD